MVVSFHLGQEASEQAASAEMDPERLHRVREQDAQGAAAAVAVGLPLDPAVVAARACHYHNSSIRRYDEIRNM